MPGWFGCGRRGSSARAFLVLGLDVWFCFRPSDHPCIRPSDFFIYGIWDKSYVLVDAGLQPAVLNLFNVLIYGIWDVSILDKCI